MSRQTKHFYEFGPFRVDPAERRLLRDGQPVPLPPKAFETLLALVQNSGHLLTKDELLKTVWPESFVEENNLTQHVSALRRALGDGGDSGGYIETVPRLGYRFAPGVREVLDEGESVVFENRTKYRVVVKEEEHEETTDDEHSIETRTLPAALTPPRVRWRPLHVALMISAIVALAAVLLLMVSKSGKKETSEAVKPAAFRSIAVLPFKTIGTDDEYLGLGMADTLITRLGHIKQVSVRPLSAIHKYVGLEHDPVAVGRTLGVEAVLDGSIQQANNRIRVRVQFVNTSSGTPLWTEYFDEKLTDIFTIQDHVSDRISRTMALELTGEENRQLNKRYTENIEAYHFYLKGRYFAAKWTQEGYKKGIEYFNKAIAIDPNYALAYDGLAYCYYNSFYLPFKEAMTEGRALAKRALEIDPSLAEAHVSLGIIHGWLDYDWPAAEREFKRGIELKPNYASAHLWYGVYLSALERSQESIAEIKRAIELDPLSAEANTGLGVVLFYARRYDEANEQLRKTLDLKPDFWFARLYLARVYEKKGDLPAAIAELEKASLIKGASTEVLSALGYTYAVSGKKEKAQNIIVELKEQSKRSYVPAYNIATIYAGLGEKDRAFEYLDEEYAEGAYYLNYINVDPELDSLRSDPRFTDLLRRMRLAS